MKTTESAVHAFRANIVILCLVPVVDLGLSLLGNGTSGYILKLFLATYVLFLLHRTILIGSPSGLALKH